MKLTVEILWGKKHLVEMGKNTFSTRIGRNIMQLLSGAIVYDNACSRRTKNPMTKRGVRTDE